MASFVKMIINAVLGKLIEFGVNYFKRMQKQKQNESKNKEAVDKVKNSKTKEEIDDALDSIGDRTTNK